MMLTKKSLFTGRTHTREIDVDPVTYVAWNDGVSGLLQDTFPDLNDDDREFILSGTTPEEWDAMFLKGS